MKLGSPPAHQPICPPASQPTSQPCSQPLPTLAAPLARCSSAVAPPPLKACLLTFSLICLCVSLQRWVAMGVGMGVELRAGRVDLPFDLLVLETPMFFTRLQAHNRVASCSPLHCPLLPPDKRGPGVIAGPSCAPTPLCPNSSLRPGSSLQANDATMRTMDGKPSRKAVLHT